MQPPVLHKIRDQNFWLSASRSIYWEEQKALIMSDVHLGKSGHFRKAGIGVPQNVLKDDMQRFIEVVQHFHPEKIIIVGDLFHSNANKELEFFIKWRRDISHIEFHLVQGNHDILGNTWYSDAGINVTDLLHINSFVFCHDVACITNLQEPHVVTKKNPAVKNMKSHQLAYNFFRNSGYYSSEINEIDIKEEWKGSFIFSGHLHPGVTVTGSGKQALRFPGFYFFDNYCIVPAFGIFTGLASITTRKQHIVYAIVDQSIIKL